MILWSGCTDFDAVDLGIAIGTAAHLPIDPQEKVYCVQPKIAASFGVLGFLDHNKLKQDTGAA